MGLTSGSCNPGRRMEVVRSIAVVVILATGTLPALSDERPDSASGIAPDFPVAWTGLYVGGHVAQRLSHADALLQAPDGGEKSTRAGSLNGGIQAGYNVVTGGRILAGVELDFSFPNYFGADDLVWSTLTPQGHFSERMDYLASLRGRVGYIFGPWLLYGTGGYAWAGVHVFNTPLGSDDERGRAQLHSGWSAGMGAERAIDRYWKMRLEYLHTDLAAAKVSLAPIAQYRSAIETDAVRIGLSRALNSTNGEAGGRDDAAEGPSRWEIHGQTTFVEQGYPAFHAPYSGANSLSPARRCGAARTRTGVRNMLRMPASSTGNTVSSSTTPDDCPSLARTKPNSPNCASPTPASQAARAGKRIASAAIVASMPLPNRNPARSSATATGCATRIR